MSKSEAYQIVLEDLEKISLLRGVYDATHGNEHFMYGIATVMEIIANGVSDERYTQFSAMFDNNMIASEERAEEKKDDSIE